MPSRWLNVSCIGVLCSWLTGAPLAFGQSPDPGRIKIAVEALQRLKGIDLEANPALKAAVLKVLESTHGTPQFVEIVREFNLKGQSPALLDFAIHHPADGAGVDALRLVLANGDVDLVRKALDGSNPLPLLQCLGNTGDKRAVPELERVLTDPHREMNVRQEAVHAVAQTLEGAEFLIDLAAKPSMTPELAAAAGLDLRNCRWPEIKAKAATAFPGSEPQSTAPLPPIRQLAAMKGDPARGAEVFKREVVGCAKCHQVHGYGADVGPNLSEIGTKLAKEAIYEAILDPSAGIAFGYEAWEIEFKNGDDAYGLIASQTANEMAIKGPNGIVTHYKKADIARQTQQKTSMMPTGLAQTMSQQDLVDLVEYLASLKKSG